MLDYKEVTLEDKKWVEKIFKKCQRRGNEYTFSNLFDWAEPMNVKIAKYKDSVIFKNFDDNNLYSCPVGENLIEAISLILDEVHKENNKLKLINIDEEDVPLIEKAFPGVFSFYERRDDFDYIYETADLGELKGRKHSVKRNHLNKFLNLYPDWHFEEINETNIADVRKMADEWYEEALKTKEPSIEIERQAVEKGFDNYFALELTGGIIYVKDEIAAFCFGHNSSDDTMVVHAEKAFTKFECAYTVITKEFTKFVSKKYKYINREDDMGLEGLRTSKLSYRPCFFYKKFGANEV